MKKTSELDFFGDNPVKEFVGAGFHKYRPCWGWERRISNASFYLIADGKLKFTLHDTVFTAEKNDVVFLKSCDTAIIENEGENYSSLYYIAFNYDEEYDLCIGMINKNTSYRNLFKDILDSHLSKAPFSKLKITQLFLRLLYGLSVDNLHANKDYMNVSRINAAAEYINVNYYKNITMSDLGRVSGYSESHLRRLFVKNFGMSPQNYIVEKRMEMAKEMLLDIPEKNVDEIADLLGISSSSYFCKLFKSKTGMSPLEFKRLNMNT